MSFSRAGQSQCWRSWSPGLHLTARLGVRREALGSASCRMAFLSPVPPDMVVYGSGEAALILTRVSK